MTIPRLPALLLLAAATCATGCASHSSNSASSSFTGKASWYGKAYAGRPTASGELFDPAQMTAAHKTLAFGTRVRVTHLGNGRGVVVRINDRGPFGAGRVIDLSEEAARELGMIQEGVANVRVEVLAR